VSVILPLAASGHREGALLVPGLCFLGLASYGLLARCRLA